MFPTLVFGLLLLGASVRYAVKPEGRWVPLQLALGVLTLTSGMLGFVTGVITTTQHLAELPSERIGLVGATGVGESLSNVGLALLLMMVAALLTSVGAVRLTRVPA
ncbi:MAG TPA: hypothetical protein VLT33_04540 [Labilithrix sp.]|nr:hypothetical protein [Labilithrix sp.]